MITITETLSNRLKELRDTQTQLETNLEPLQVVKDEIVLIERMLGLVDNGEFLRTHQDETKQEIRKDLVNALQSFILPIEE